jgi:hypothetical protein
VAPVDKFNAARIPVSPHHMAVLCRFETIEREIKLKGGSVKRERTKPGPSIVEIHNSAGMDAGNAVKVKQCELNNFSALQGSTLNH